MDTRTRLRLFYWKHNQQSSGVEAVADFTLRCSKRVSLPSPTPNIQAPESIFCPVHNGKVPGKHVSTLYLLFDRVNDQSGVLKF
jgi:hypothetical protein